MIKTPKNCLICRGNENATQLIKVFTEPYKNGEYGHAMCRRCGITFDSNVNDIYETSSDSLLELADTDDEEYRKLFVEHSKIADDDNNVYASFGWEDNHALKAGVVKPVIQDLDQCFPSGVFSLVDVGCGNGFTAMEFAIRYPGATIHAVDPSPLILSVNGKKENLSAERGTLQSVSLTSGSVDVVCIIGNWMLHFDPLDTLYEARRVLRRDGVLILDFKNVNSFARIFAKVLLRARVRGDRVDKYLHRNFANMRYGFTKAYVERLLIELQFVPFQIRSKAPRLLHFQNQSIYQKGLVGLLWRSMDYLDQLRGEQAWIQVASKCNHSSKTT